MTHYGDDLVPGTRLEEFELERTLGTGGFGVTYLAWDRSLDRRVAIKEYMPRDWGSRRADGSVGPRSASDVEDYRWGLDRFLAEARILAKLEHPHIVRAHRIIAAAHGTAYMVMEYVEGRSLREELAAEGTLPEMRVRGILVALTAGLEPVHAKGLLHRDIKPANVMLRAKDGAPVLIDFGAARQVMGQQSRSVTSVLTPGYAPIELYETHGHQGPWTDIYALGALAYVSLTGRLPEDATTRVRNDRLRSLEQPAGEPVSQGLATAVTAALRVNESDRPQTLDAWRALLEGPGVGEETTPTGEEIAQVEKEEMLAGGGRETAPVREESTPVEKGMPPVGEESTSAGEESTPVGEDNRPAANAVLFGGEPHPPPSVSRWRLYGVAAGIAGAALLGVLLTIENRTGGDGATDAAVAADRGGAGDTVDASGAAAGLGDVADAGGAADGSEVAADGGAASGLAADGGSATDLGTALGGDGPTGGNPDDRDDPAQAETGLGLDREAKRVVQEGLVAAGFDPGMPDGFFGDRTRLALREWQAAQGMEETGYLDRAAVEALSAEDLVEADLVEADLVEADLVEADLVEADLVEADLVEADLVEADLVEADLVEADLVEADLVEADLVEADLVEADLVEADLVEADPVEEDLERSSAPPPDPPTTTRVEATDDEPVPASVEPSPSGTVAPAPDREAPFVPLTVFRDCPDCPEMVVVPPGTFRMGSSEGEDNERPVRNVRLGIFAIGRYEVTRDEYVAFATATDHASESCNVVDDRGDLRWNPRASWLDPRFEQEDRHPVVCVGWEDALAYVRWLGARTGERYRLPSEAEWEYAARAETVTERYWDGGSNGQCGNANGADRTLLQRFGGWSLPAAECVDGVVHTAQVGSYEPNAFRLYDMFGNVWEWMADCWHDNYQGAPVDGSAWDDESCDGRVWRGGSWETAQAGLRSANRFRNDERANNIAGFRVVREFRRR